MNAAPSALRQLALTLLTALLVASCNTGGGLVASGGIGGTGVTAVSVGPITQFGSIYVNGIEYDLTNASIVVNGTDVTAGDTGNHNLTAPNYLALGQVVKVTGTVDSNGTKGTATQVTFNADVNGPISSYQNVDPGTKELTVLGQPVVVDQDTKFAGTLPSGKAFSFDDVTDKQVVEVSGLTNAGGKLHATYLKFEEDNASANTTVDLKGAVSNLDTPQVGTFTINSQIVDYTNADTSSLPNGLQNNQLVEVTGTVDTSNVVHATQIKLESEGLGGGDAQSADIEGFVTNFTSPANVFTVDSQQVQTTGSTLYAGGLVSDLGPGVKVEVKGALLNGVLTAAKIIFKDDVALEGTVASLSSNTLTLKGLTSVSVGVNSLTQLGSGLTLPLPSSLQDKYVKIRGRADSSGNTATATELDIESNSPSSDITLQGPATVSSSIVTILAVSIDAHNISSFSSGDTNLSETQFLAAVQPGYVVKVEGTVSGGTVNWQNMELEK